MDTHSNSFGGLRVGELARRTGVSVRTLHYYHEIDLLTPSLHAPGDHRLYGAAEVSRLQQIRSLQQLGLSLKEIKECLEREDFSHAELLRRHVAKLRERMESDLRLCRRLEALAERLGSGRQVSTAEFLEATLEISMFEKYYTQAQQQQLEERARTVGEDRIREVQAEWPRLIARMTAEMERGTDPASEVVQELAREWRGLIDEFTGGDPGLRESLRNVYRGEPEVAERNGLDPRLTAFVGRAFEAGPN